MTRNSIPTQVKRAVRAAVARESVTVARASGFSLIELLITVAIIGVLASGAVSLVENAVKRSRESELRSDLRTIRTAIDAYKAASDAGRIAHSADASGYPPSLGVLVSGIEDAKSPIRKKLFFLRRLPIDPMSADGAQQIDAGWGLRSYQSDPDDPQPGADVYDVYSLSPKLGLNGVPYRLW